jgi:polysaccharide pyruvyl transferase CsaB
VSALLFAEEEMLGARGQLKQIISLFNSRSYRIGWIEFNIQDGIVQYLHLLSETRPFVRVHSISRKEIDQVYDVPRAVARWVRAVKDRSMKMLYIRCFFQDKQRYIADLAQFNLNYLHRTSESLKQNGFVVAQTHNQRLNEPRHMVGVLSSAERIAIALALLMGLVLLLNHSFLLSMDSRWYFAAPVLAVLLFFVLNRESYNALFGLIGAISYSCLGLVLAFNRFKKSSAGFSDQLVFIITLVVPSLIGGLLIAGLHSEIDYLLKFSQFRGIKLAFVVPILFVMLWSFKEFGKGLVELINRPLTPLSASIIGAIAIGFTAYLLRSGNLTALKPSAIEDGFRTFLENTLVARPRNKEFLVGYPAALLFIFFFIRKRVSLLPVLAIFIQMGQVSVVNTLCHFHSPLGLSLLRIFNGFWVGIVVGIPVLLSAMLFYVVSLIGDKKNNSIVLAGYLGFKNFGDELLWQTFCRNLNSDYQIKVLLADESELPKNLSDKAFPLSRSHKFALLESLLTCKAIVFAGGGVFQAKTSFVSLLYYLTLLTITRFSGGQVILMAQGFGPWGIWQKRFPRFFAWLARFLSASDYISVRDNDSADWIESKSDTKIPVTADYVFAEASFSPGKIKKPESVLKVAVILRSSEPESKRIAKIFIRLATETENLQLMPVAFQNGDETVWQNAGWENEVKNYDPAFPAQVFADLDLVVSMRLHGCIIATAKAIPWIGLAYDPKLHAFARQIKWKFCYELEKLDRALIENKMNLLAVKKVELAQKLARYSNELSRRAAKDLQNVVDCLKK